MSRYGVARAQRTIGGAHTPHWTFKYFFSLPRLHDEHFTKCREILAGVNAQGSYKRYVRAPHREFLRFRSLLVRGRAKTNGLNERIARLPNGACWKVLSYWREDN